MRSALTRPVSTLLFLLVWSSLWLPSCVARGRSEPARAGEQPSAHAHEFPPVLGRGITQNDALRDAVKKARPLIDDYLQEMDPPVTWRPSALYIQENLIKDKDQPTPVPEKDERVDNDTIVRCWKWTLAIAPDDWYDIHYRDRRARSERRMSLLGRILLGLVALFAVVAAYIRADDWLKGYYTGWLRAAAIAALALAATGVWWIS